MTRHPDPHPQSHAPTASATSHRRLILSSSAVVATLLLVASFVGTRLVGGDDHAVRATTGPDVTPTSAAPVEQSPERDASDEAAPTELATLADLRPTASGGEPTSTTSSTSDVLHAVEVGVEDSIVEVGAGELVLGDADMEIVTDDAGRLAPGTTGVASLQLPTDGPLAGAMLDRALRGAIGVATGSELAHLGAHLRDEERYLYADLGTQPFELFLDLDATQTGAGALPQRISTTGNAGSSMFVAGLDGDYFYLSTPCPAMIPAGKATTSRPARQRPSDHAGADATEIPGISADLSAFDPGGCGFGWSVGGFVPFTSLMDERTIEIPNGFGAHVVVDGTIPLSAGLSLDGELFYRFDTDRASIWANGELDVGLTFLKGAAEVQLPAVRGTFGLEITASNLDLWLTATAGSNAADSGPAALLADIAPIRGSVDVDGELHIASGDVLDNSFLQLAGSISISPMPVRIESDVEVDDLLTAEALVRIDRDGVMVRGALDVSPLGPLALRGSAELEFLVPFTDPASSYVQVRGAMAIGDTTLGADAELRIDRDGALARGSIDLAGMGGLTVEGWLGPDGFQLTGAVEAVLPIGDLDKVAAGLVDQTANDEVIRVLHTQIDERLDQIAAGNPSKGTELRNTVDDMRAAFATIASARETIAYNDGLIAQYWRDHKADIDWHWALSGFDQAFDKIPHGIRLGAILVKIEALKGANTLQYGYIAGANLVVSGVQQLVLGIIGWDTQLNALLALQTEAYVSTLAGTFIATVLNGADAILDAFGIDGSAVGTATFTVGTEGIGATAELQWCRDGSCDTLAGATVTLTPAVEVCATIVGVPSCVRL